jgi:late competence protein required for DNA uptake (superfamily II DNA/RNA helicase)
MFVRSRKQFDWKEVNRMECQKCKQVSPTVEVKYYASQKNPSGQYCLFCWGLVRFIRWRRDQMVEALKEFAKKPTKENQQTVTDSMIRYRAAVVDGRKPKEASGIQAVNLE